MASEAGIPRKIGDLWGAAPENLKEMYEMDGAIVTAKPPRKNSSGNAQVYTVEGHPTVKEVQYHIGGGVHGDGQYYKVTMKDGSTVKVIDPNSGYSPGTITNKQEYYDPEGNRLKYEGGEWKTWE